MSILFFSQTSCSQIPGKLCVRSMKLSWQPWSSKEKTRPQILPVVKCFWNQKFMCQIVGLIMMGALLNLSRPQPQLKMKRNQSMGCNSGVWNSHGWNIILAHIANSSELHVHMDTFEGWNLLVIRPNPVPNFSTTLWIWKPLQTQSGLSSWPLRLLMPSWRPLGVGSLHHQRLLPVGPRKQLLKRVVSLRPGQWPHHQRDPPRKLQWNQGLVWRSQRLFRRRSSRNPRQSPFPSPLFPLRPRNRRSDIVARAQQHLLPVRSPKLSSSRR